MKEDVFEVRWLIHGHPVPDGWRIVPNHHPAHHDDHAVLIERVADDATDPPP